MLYNAQVYPVGKLMEITSKFVLGLMGVKVPRRGTGAGGDGEYGRGLTGTCAGGGGGGGDGGVATSLWPPLQQLGRM